MEEKQITDMLMKGYQQWKQEQQKDKPADMQIPDKLTHPFRSKLTHPLFGSDLMLQRYY